MTSTYVVGSWIDDFSKSQDRDARINAMSKLCEISKELGPEKTRTELFVFLRHFLDDDDEVTIVLAQQLGKLFPFLGGAEHVGSVIPLLEGLANTEEAKIRDEALQSLLTLIHECKGSQVQVFVDLLFRLAKADWFTSRASSLGLFSSVYEIGSDAVKSDLVELYCQLARDSMPLVRRAAANKLGEWKIPNGESVKGFVAVVNDATVLDKLVPSFIALAQDNQDSVKFLAVESCSSVSSRLTQEQNDTLILPVLKKLFEDSSWRVRYTVAENIPKLQLALGPKVTEEILIDVFLNMLKDNEAEVRTVACGSVADFCKNLPESIKLKITQQVIFPVLGNLMVDTSQQVRAALASKLLHLSPVIGQEATISMLIPEMLKLLKDEFPEVRLIIISNLNCVNDVIGSYPLVTSLIPAISELAEDRQWRVRLAVIKYIPMLSKLLGVEVREQFASFCTTWLVDCVFTIREAATESVKDLTEVFGVEWASEAIFPQILKLKDHPNYLYRMTTLFAINALLPILKPEVVIAKLFPIASAMVRDPVANVRFNVAKSLGLIAQKLSDQPNKVKNDVTPLLEEMKNDSDKDVKYYAVQGLGLVGAA